MTRGEEHPSSRKGLVRRALVFALMPFAVGAVVGSMAANLDWHQLYQVLLGSDLRLVLIALGLVALAYFAYAFSYVLVNRSFGIRLQEWDLLRIGLITSVLVAAAGGVAGHSVRKWRALIICLGCPWRKRCWSRCSSDWSTRWRHS